MIYEELKDEELVAMTLLGNQNAYCALVLRWQNTVLAAARQITRSEPLSEDAAQDAFVTAWLKLNTLHDGSKYGAWVVRIVKNRAKDLLIRYREWVDVDLLAATEDINSRSYDIMIPTDENELLHDNIGALTEKVRKVIELHYFGGYSIAEIAKILAVPQGTVKARLHEGRKKLRKEYGLMDEKETDTLVEKVIKKVEEFNYWQYREDKRGFETVWRECLDAVGNLPECRQKYHALADTLIYGYWWVKGEANDEVLARIRDAAERSHNENVMQELIGIEMFRAAGDDRIKIAREVLIPRMEKQKFFKVVGYIHFWLGHELIMSGDTAGGVSEFQKVLEVLSPADVYHAFAQAAFACERSDMPEKTMRGAGGEEYRIIDGQYRLWSQPGYCRNDIPEISTAAIGYDSARFEGRMFIPGARVGDKHISPDGKTELTFEQDGASVQTPCGLFSGCQIWCSREHLERHDIVVKTYYKDGVGIVYQETTDPQTRNYAVMLTDYTIVGGSGLLPFAAGNKWEYTFKKLNHETVPHTVHREVTYADGQRAIVSEYITGIRLGYNPDSWEEAVTELREKYQTELDPQTGEARILDMTDVIERAERLARSPFEKAYTKAACAVVRQMMEGEPALHDSPKIHTHWTFFESETVDRERMCTIASGLYSFNLKDMGAPGDRESRHPLLYNRIYDILQSTANTLWSDDWTVGARLEREFTLYGIEVKSQIAVSDAGTVTTAAGRFENCIKLNITCKGLTDGLSYIADPAEYYMAPGVGIVKTVHYYGNERQYTGIYELSSYIGTGEGYFPLERGMERVYEAVGLRDGYVSQSTYYCEQDENSTLRLIVACLGYRKL